MLYKKVFIRKVAAVFSKKRGRFAANLESNTFLKKTYTDETLTLTAAASQTVASVKAKVTAN